MAVIGLKSTPAVFGTPDLSVGGSVDPAAAARRLLGIAAGTALDARDAEAIGRIGRVLSRSTINPTSGRSLRPAVPLSRWLYDADACFGIRGERELNEKAYILLSDIDDRRQALGESNGSTAGTDLSPSLPQGSKMAARHGPRVFAEMLMARLDLMAGLAHAAIAVRMARRRESQYSMAALQTAADELDRAVSLETRATGDTVRPGNAESADEKRSPLETLAPDMPVDEVQDIWRRLFAVWDTARATGKADGIAALSLAKILNAAEVDAARLPANARWTALHNFAWIDLPADQSVH